MEAPGLERVAHQWREGELSAVQAAKKLGMSRATFYRRVKDLQPEK